MVDSHHLNFSIIVKHLYLSLEVEGQASDAVRVHILEDGHSLHGVGVPYADIRLLAHLSCGHQHTLGMQSQTVSREREKGTESVWLAVPFYKRACVLFRRGIHPPSRPLIGQRLQNLGDFRDADQ